MLTHLYQLSNTGKVKHLLLSVNGNEFTTEWYTTDKDGVSNPSKKQSTTKKCKAVNVGKSNEVSAEEQAVLELQRKVTEKCDEGYITDLTNAISKKVATLDISRQLPREFAPSKPISETPKDALNGEYFAEHKYNGVCVILHNTGTEKIIYTRRMLPIQHIVCVVEDVKVKLEKTPELSVVVGELVAFDPDGIEDKSVLACVTNDETTIEKAQARYDELTKIGWRFEYKAYEVIFYKGEDITKKSFDERNAILEPIYGKRDLIEFTQAAIDKARAAKTEGYIIRRKDSVYGFNLKGKEKREGAYKFKFEYPTDVIVTKISNGVGRHEKRVARFYMHQYDKAGNLIGCGWAGLGQLGEDIADELTTNLRTKGYKIDGEEVLDPKHQFALEIKYQSRQKKVNKKGELCFEFPVPLHIRYDKRLEDCVIE